jgi:Ca2+-binding RTX toxin-like protein
MNRRLRWWPLVIMALVLTIGASAQTSANTVASTKVEDDSRTIGANDLKPVECAALALTTLVTGSAISNGTSGNDLELGTSGNDNMNGGGGNDCLIGGAGTDTLNGGPGTDVCIGGGGNDTFKGCETQIQ